MPALRPALLQLLALLLLCQCAAMLQPRMRSVVAFGGAQEAMICGAEGHYTLLLDRSGKPLPFPKHHGGCPLCANPAGGDLPSPPVIATGVGFLIAKAGAAPHMRLMVGSPRGPPQQPRAPPLVWSCSADGACTALLA